MSTLRICHVVPHLDRVGGLERAALALARHQCHRQGLHAVVLTHAVTPAAMHAVAHAPSEPPPDEPLGPGIPADRAGGPVIQRLERGLRRYHPGGWWRNLGEPFSVVHAHAMHVLCGQVVALAHRDGIPCVVKVATPSDVDLFGDPDGWRRLAEPDGGEPAPGLRRRWRLRTAFHRLRRAGAFVALNDEIAAALARHGLPAERLPNGVDCRHFRPVSASERAAARAGLGLRQDAFVALFAGRLVLRKDVACLLDAVARLPAQPAGSGAAPLVLLIAGDGAQATTLRARADAAGLHERVLFTGLRHDVRPLLASADVCVNPARSEGQPNAVLEAWASGLPTVLSDIAGHRDGPSAPGEAAAFFPAGDSEALAATLAHVAAQPARRAAMGDAARRLALQRYSLDLLAERYVQLYRRLLSGRPREQTAGA